MIDFSLPEGVAVAAHWCAANRVALLSGVTGLQAPEMDALRRAANTTAVLWSPNLSLGVNLLAQLCAMAGRMMKPETRVSIADVHHQWKQDAPSGTALMLGAAIDVGRSGSVPAISYSSVREGEIIGQHSVTLEWPGEKIVLQHEALDRALFAEGALDAARWLSRQTPGFYSAADWLAGR
jgi:4-hydroxy-tetrahydrodipicolinate reductase